MVSQATGIIFEWIFLVLIFTLILKAGHWILVPRSPALLEILLTALFSSGLMVAMIKRVTMEDPYPGFRQTVALSATGRSPLKLIASPIFIGLILAMISSFMMMTRPVIPKTPFNEMLGKMDSSGIVIFFLVLALGIAPLLEEIIFRGYFFYVIQQFKGTRFAIYFIALTFSFLHVGQYWGDWAAILVVTVLGFVLTLLRVLNRSTIPSIIAHYAYNTGVVIFSISILLGSNPSYLKYQLARSSLDAAAKERLLVESIKHRPEFIDPYNDLAWLYAEQGIKLKGGSGAD